MRIPNKTGSCQDQPMAKTVSDGDPEPQESQLGDAVLDALRGGLRILGGMVQLAAGITRLLAVTALRAAEAVQQAVEAAEEEEKPEPQSERKPR
jgi:hypothetical protein